MSDQKKQASAGQPAQRGDFTEVWDGFSQVAHLEPVEVGKLLGGKVGYNLTTLRNPSDPDSHIFPNACAIRMSHALNEAGMPIPNIPGQVSSDAEGRWNFFRLKDMEAYLTRTYGPPDVVSSDINDFIGKQGIIEFVVDTWTDANGHFGLVDGVHTADGHDYSNRATVMKMWTFKGPEAQEQTAAPGISYGRSVTLSGQEFDDLAKNNGIHGFGLEASGHFTPNSVGIVSLTAFGPVREGSFPDVNIREVRDAEGSVIGYFASGADPKKGFYLKPDELDIKVISEYKEELALPEASTKAVLPPVLPSATPALAAPLNAPVNGPSPS